MRRIFSLSAFALFAVLATFQASVTSCTKEIITHDTVTIIQKDTLFEIRIDTVVLVNSDIPAVNPGPDSTFLLSASTDSLKLSGSATEPGAQIVAYLWSQVSGPNTALITNPGAATTYITSLAAGTYVFQLMALDDRGATGVKSLTLTIKTQEPVTLKLQPHQNEQEVLLALVGPLDQSSRIAPDLDAAAWTVNGAPTYLRGLFKFDMAAIPATAKIVSAKLTLFSDPAPVNGNLIDANFGDNNTLLLQRVTTSWGPSVTWHTQPAADAATQVVIPHTTQSRLDLVDVDVSRLVKDMRQFGNHGFLIKLQSEFQYNSRLFCSSKHANAAKHPKLVLTYTK